VRVRSSISFEVVEEPRLTGKTQKRPEISLATAGSLHRQPPASHASIHQMVASSCTVPAVDEGDGRVRARAVEVAQKVQREVRANQPALDTRPRSSREDPDFVRCVPAKI